MYIYIEHLSRNLNLEILICVIHKYRNYLQTLKYNITLYIIQSN